MADTAAAPESVSPPAGTGNAPGLGEAFTLDLNTGQGGYSVAITLPEGVADFHPTVKLEYRHGTVHGPFGAGWQLPVRTVDRRLDYGVPGGDTVERFFGDGQELIDFGGGVFAPAVEAAFNRYVRSGDGWVITERSGKRHELGLTPAGRVADPDHPERVITWLLERSLDTSGNAITYTYQRDGGVAYLASIAYAIYVVRLVYEARPDVHRNGRAGFLRTLTRRCASIELHASLATGDRLVRRWTLSYQQAPYVEASLLDSVQLTSFGPATDGSGDVVRPPQRFTYSALDPSAWRARFVNYDTASPPPPLTDSDTNLVPLGAGGLPSIVQARNGRFTHWPNDGAGGFAAGRPLRDTPAIAGLRESGVQILDLDGDGRVDLLVGVGGHAINGYYTEGGEDGWGRFVAYPRANRAVPPFESGRARMADLDGDGNVDALAAAGRSYGVWMNHREQGWDEPRAQPMGDGDNGPDADLADPLVRLADMIGDGLPDLVRIRSGHIEYWPNLGHGRFGARVVMHASPAIDAIADPRRFHLVDLDGDGCADLVEVSAAGVTAWINRSGVSWSDAIVDPLVPPPIPGTVVPASMDGKTATGLVWCAPRSGRTSYVWYDMAGTTPPHHLTGVDNGAGLVSEIEYASAAEMEMRDRSDGVLWSGALPFPLSVVRATRELDTMTGQRAESVYRYHDGYFDPATRTFQGFARVEKIETGDASRPDGHVVFHYLVGQDRLAGQGRESAALNRLLSRTEFFQLDASPLAARTCRVEESDYRLQVLGTAPDGRQRVWVAVNRTARRWTERTDDERIEERLYLYDADGNVTRETVRYSGVAAGTPKPVVETRSDITYATNVAAHIIDRPARVVVRDAAGTLIAETQRFFDGPAFVGLPLGGADRGLLSREMRWVMTRVAFDAHYGAMDRVALGYVDGVDADGAAAVFACTTRKSYDAAGRVVGERSPTGTTTTHIYDPTGLFRATTGGPLGNTTTGYDLVVGKPVSITDADGSAVTMRYDAQGRLTTVVLPGDTLALPTRRYRYEDATLPNAVRVSHRIEHGAPATLETAVYFDGRMRELQRRASMAAGQVVVSGHTVRNPWGDAAAEYEPTFEGSLAYAVPNLIGRPARFFSYDSDGRPVRTVDYRGGISTAVYKPFVIETADANDTDSSPANVARGHFATPRRERLDVCHRRVAVEEIGAGGAVVAVTYQPSALGYLLSHADARGDVARSTFDGLGNRLTINHRDAGARRLFYDAGRRTMRTLDAAGNDVVARFDAADRVVRLDINGATTETYLYDDVATNGFGRLREVTYPGGRQRFGYNARRQVVAHTYEVDGAAAPFNFSYVYDALGKQRAVTYPDGSTVTTEYYDNGMPRRIPGFVDAIEYDARLLVTRLRYANGVTTDVRYTPGIGRVAHQRTTGPGTTVLDDQTYGYDALGKVLSIDHAEPGAVGATTFIYDPLYQLTRVTDTRGAGSDIAYAYDARRMTMNGESGVSLTYGDAVHPGRVSSITQAATTTALTYDANGNLAGLPGRTFTFDAKGQLTRVTRPSGVTADYGYDHHGRRVRKDVNTPGSGHNITFMFGQLAEVRNGQLARFVVVGRTRVALVYQGSTRWIHTDPVGSATFFTDEIGIRIARIAYSAFGNPRDRSGSAPMQVFALHEWDADAGLYFMQRRYYAPELGRFISADAVYLFQPERAVEQPANLELYGYTGNDPVNNVDPSGASFWSVLGAIVGVIVAVVVAVVVVAAFAIGIGWGILAIVGVIGLITAGYGLASANQGNAFGDFMKGFLIGLNAGLNAIIAGAIFGPVVGIALGVIGFLAVFDSVRQNGFYQGVLGWSQWLMPMSWLVDAIGLIFFVVNLVLAGVTFQQVAALRIDYIRIDWATGSLIMKGGALSNANPIDTAYDMGHFVFVDTANTAPDDDIPHELGHTLNLAIFGSIVHFIGFIDEMGGISGANAWTERMADSHSPRRRAEIRALGGVPDDTWG